MASADSLGTTCRLSKSDTEGCRLLRIRKTVLRFAAVKYSFAFLQLTTDEYTIFPFFNEFGFYHISRVIFPRNFFDYLLISYVSLRFNVRDRFASRVQFIQTKYFRE